MLKSEISNHDSLNLYELNQHVHHVKHFFRIPLWNNSGNLVQVSKDCTQKKINEETFVEFIDSNNCKNISLFKDINFENDEIEKKVIAVVYTKFKKQFISQISSNCLEDRNDLENNQYSESYLANELYYQNTFKTNFPLLVVFLNAEQDAFIFKLFNGKNYSLNINEFKSQFSQEIERRELSFFNVKDLWDIANFSEIIIPIIDVGSTISTIEPHLICFNRIQNLHSNKIIFQKNLMPLKLQKLDFGMYNQDFNTFLIELNHYQVKGVIESQIILFLDILTRGSPDFLTSTNMRHIYNMWKKLLKFCAENMNIGNDLIQYFTEYTNYCDQTIGLIGQAWIHMQSYEKKSRSYFKAFTLLHQIQLKPNIFPKQAAFVYFSLGRLQKSNEEGINMYTKSIELNPKNSFTFNNRASRFNSFAPDLSIQDYTLAIELDSTDPHLYFKRALLYKRCSQHEEASLDFSKTISLDPSNNQAYYYRAHINQMFLHNYSVALHDYTKVIENTTNKQLLVKAYFSRGSLYSTHLDELFAALNDFNKSLELNPQYSNSLYAKKNIMVKLRKLTCVGNI